MCRFVLLTLAVAMPSIVHGMGASSDVLQKVEETAFSMCATNTEDSCDGLTWAEVELCLATYGHLLKARAEAMGLTIPTKADFDREDGLGNGDGCLTFAEWKNAEFPEK